MKIKFQNIFEHKVWDYMIKASGILYIQKITLQTECICFGIKVLYFFKN